MSRSEGTEAPMREAPWSGLRQRQSLNNLAATITTQRAKSSLYDHMIKWKCGGGGGESKGEGSKKVWDF